MDAVVPIVFPDYLIGVNTPKLKVNIPDILPVIDLFPDSVVIPGKKNKVPDLGHAGVLLINGGNGATKYYEYGRYDPANLGLVRRITIGNVVMGKDGRPTSDSLKIVMAQISRKAGQGGRVSGAYVEVKSKYGDMLNYAQIRLKQNSNPKREPYSLTSNSCIHFVKKVAEAGGVDTPWMVDPRPTSYIGEFRSEYPDLNYDPSSGTVEIEGWKPKP